ncbi:hypothetical protein D9M71_650740 [compost metagenome]
MEAREPVKENSGTGTGIGTLMPTWPTSISSWKCRAAAPERVKRAVPLPLGLALIRAMASSMVAACMTQSTGPKTSSR